MNNNDYSINSCRHNSLLMLPVSDWMSEIPSDGRVYDLVEVQFKNTRKGYYRNSEGLSLTKGSMVIVEANPGYDLGIVTLTGKLVEHQMKKNRIDLNRYEIRQVLRLATEADIEKRDEAKKKEQDTMIRARQLAKSLGLEMKIGDVEYQGDGSKAIFYYIADQRVDFRQLIKVYAETFRVRIEMKQIGARQEAGRIGGTGPCGRELCCTTWLQNFYSVGTNAARTQNISLNPQKLAGQCAKLKCCLQYELAQYEEAAAKMPSRHQALETRDATYYMFSSDPLKGEITYSTAQNMPVNLQVISVQEALDIIEMNRRGERPLSLGGKQTVATADTFDYQNVVGQDDVTRFDKKRQKQRSQQNNRRQRPPKHQ